ncbi:MAG: hypothetical protein IPP01_04880 [Saprospiraceae bacterium]|nr:hypothetical protein [Saprospiraceae bacterium]
MFRTTTWNELYDQIINVNDPCGVKVKVVREWKILDWCTGQMYQKNQVIRVFCSEDTIRPIPSCLSLVTVLFGCEMVLQ